MTPDQRDTLLDLHRAAMRTLDEYLSGNQTVRVSEVTAADDAFRAYLFALPVPSHT